MPRSLQHLGAADVVFPKGVAAIQDDIARFQQCRELGNGVFGDLAGWQHHPDRARCPQLLHQLVETRRAGGAVATERGNSLGIAIVNDDLMAMLHQAARDIAAHPPETDHADLHCPHSLHARVRWTAASSAARPDFKSPLRWTRKRAAAAFEQNVEIAARLRGLDHAKARAVAWNGQIPRVVCSNLEEHAAVGSALVGLPGRMQKARTEFEAGRDMAAIA